MRLEVGAETSLHYIPLVLFGTLIGFVVRMLVAGRGASWGHSMLAGATGAMLGASAACLGRPDEHEQSPGFVLSLLGAFALVGALHAVAARHRAVASISREAAHSKE